jgi:hypothetical protein
MNKIAEVDLKPLQDAFAASNFTLSSLACELGWYRKDGKPDVTRVKRRLGLAPRYTKRKRGRIPFYDKRTSPENAKELMDALHVDPVDIGL